MEENVRNAENVKGKSIKITFNPKDVAIIALSVCFAVAATFAIIGNEKAHDAEKKMAIMDKELSQSRIDTKFMGRLFFCMEDGFRTFVTANFEDGDIMADNEISMAGSQMTRWYSNDFISYMCKRAVNHPSIFGMDESDDTSLKQFGGYENG